MNGDQHRRTVVAIHRAMLKGHRACPEGSFLLEGFSPLKSWSVTGVEAQVEISPLGTRLTLAGPSQAPYIQLQGVGATSNDPTRFPGLPRNSQTMLRD